MGSILAAIGVVFLFWIIPAGLLFVGLILTVVSNKSTTLDLLGICPQIKQDSHYPPSDWCGEVWGSMSMYSLIWPITVITILALLVAKICKLLTIKVFG